MENEALTDVQRAAIGGAFYLAPYTNLRLSVFNAAAGVTVTLAGQILGLDGEVRPFQFAMVPTTARAVSTAIFSPGCGWLLHAELLASAGTPRKGQCFARLELIAGREGGTLTLGTILQGYVQDTSALAYPGSAIVASPDGAGVIRSVTGTDPAVNTEIAETVPTNARWRLISIFLELVTDATVANRTVTLLVDDGANTLSSVSASAAQTATQTRQYSAYPGGGAPRLDSTVFYLPTPPGIMLMGGFRIRTTTANRAAGDNYGAPQLLVEEWIED